MKQKLNPDFEFEPIRIPKDFQPGDLQELKQVSSQALVLHEGLLNTLLKRRLREGVRAILSRISSPEFAEGNAEYITDHIIKAFLITKDPVNYGRWLSDDQVKHFHKNFTEQFGLLAKVYSDLEDGKTLDQVRLLHKLQ